jgi:hypothetical protein
MEAKNNPFDIIQSLFGQHHEQNDHWHVAAHFDQFLSNPELLKQLPLLNTTPVDKIPPRSLVRYRCMIQDMFDQELFMGLFYQVHKETGERLACHGKYQETIDIKEGYEIEEERTMDRHSLYCVPVPGENDWVIQKLRSEETNTSSAPLQNSTGVKRRREEEQVPMHIEEDKENINNFNTNMQTNQTTSAISCNNDVQFAQPAKKTKTGIEQSDNKSTVTSVLPELNFPLPAQGPACLVKVYDVDDSAFKLNDVIEVIGVLGSTVPGPDVNDDDKLMSIEEEISHCPPSSVVPRLHALTFRHVTAAPVLSPQVLQQPSVEALRTQILQFLASQVQGDVIAASYLLFNLISHVYSRSGVLALGNFSLNLISSDMQLGHRLNQLIEQLLPYSHYVPMTIENLNKAPFIPYKNNVSNKLTAGQLQLPSGTHLVVDEAQLAAGQLTQIGLANLKALHDVVLWQKLEYDFEFHTLTFNTDYPCLITSTGRSLFSKDGNCCVLPIVGPPSPQSATVEVNEQFLEVCRTYLSLIKQNEMKPVSEEVSKLIQDNFVQLRQANAKITADDFHTMLTISRYAAMSFGETELTIERFLFARTLEAQRAQRVDALPASSATQN